MTSVDADLRSGRRLETGRRSESHICQCNSRSWLNCFNDMTELSFLSQTFKNNIIKYLHNYIVWNKDVSCNSVKHDE